MRVPRKPEKPCGIRGHNRGNRFRATIECRLIIPIDDASSMEPLRPTPLPGTVELKSGVDEPVSKTRQETDPQVSTPTGKVLRIETSVPLRTEAGCEKEISLDYRSTGSASTVPSFQVRSGQGETVLIIDDQLAIRNVLQALLKTYGYNPFVAEDGPTGLACYRAHQKEIRVVILDMRMPGLQGTDVIRELRLVNEDVRIVAMSGYFTKQMEITRDTDRLVYLQKPMTGLELQTALRRVMRVPSMSEDLGSER